MGAALKFIAKAWKHVSKYGKDAIDAVVSWAKQNWRQIQRWTEAGATTVAIIEMILSSLNR